MTDDDNRLLIDATMLLRWKHLAPVGIVRLERLLAAHLRFRSRLGQAEYVVWANGYRHAESHEIESLDLLLRNGALADERTTPELVGPEPIRTGRVVPAVRRTGLQALGRLPSDVRPFAEQAAWSMATLGFESTRLIKRSWRDRRNRTTGPADATPQHVRHRVDFTRSTDLVALGLGWEYLDHLAMYELKEAFGVRIHMPAFDLIPVLMPQMNAGQSHLVHRYYAEMAHYADSITSISHATKDALERFFDQEMLPRPHLAVNQLPGFSAEESSDVQRPNRLADDEFVLSVSTVEIRKNHILLAKIWAECIREGIDMPKLVLVGRIGWDVDELLRWVDFAPELNDKFVVLTDVDDDELGEFYKHCRFTAFPSRIEGWGLPITESLTYGRACIHSTDPAQLEASQGLMPALHPDDFLGWKAELVRVCTDDAYRDELEARIADGFEARSPQDYAESFEHILEGRRRPGTSP